MTGAAVGATEKPRAPVRPRHVLALSLTPHDRYSRTRMETLDCLMRKYSGSYHSVGGDRNNEGVTLWRVSSVYDLVVRLTHVEDHSLQTLDIIGHGAPGALIVGTRPTEALGGETRADYITVDGVARLAIVARKLKRPSAGNPEPCLRLIGCSVAEKRSPRRDLIHELAGSLGVTVKGTLSFVGYRDFPKSPADLDTALIWRTARPSSSDQQKREE